MTDGALDLGARLSHRLRPWTLAIGVVLSLAAPLAYGLVQSRALHRTAGIYADELADRLNEVLLEGTRTPGTPRYVQRIFAFVSNKDIRSIRVLDGASRPVPGLDYIDASAHAWWNHGSAVATSPVIVQNDEVGSVEVSVSRGPVLDMTALLLAVSTAAAVALTMLVHRLPVHLVRGMEAWIRELIDTARSPSAELERRRAEQESLAEASRLLASTLDLHEVLDHLAEIARRLLRADIVSIWLVDGRDGELAFHSQAGATRDGVLARQRVRFKPGEGLVGRVFAERCSLTASSVETDVRVKNREFADAEQVRSFLGVPLVVEDAAVGTLAVLGCTPREWSPGEVAAAEALAVAAAIGIRNARLYEDSRRRLRHTESLLRVSEAANSTLDRSEMLRRIAREVAHALDADMVGGYLANEHGEQLIPVAGYHVPPHLRECFMAHPIPVRGHPLVEEAWVCRHPVWSTDSPNDARVDRETVRRFPHRSCVFFPIIVKGVPRGGLFAIWWERPRDFNADELRLMEGIGAQAALVVDSVRLFEETRRSLDETQSLLAVAESLGRTLDIVEVMRRVSREATRLLGADTGVFYVRDEAANLIVPMAGYHVPPDFLELARSYSVAEIPEVILTTFVSGRTLVLGDVMADPQIATDLVKAAGIRSLLATPVATKDRVFGCLVLFWRKRAHETTEAELKLVGVLTGQGAVALENARLFAETRAQAAALREKNAELDSFVYSVSHDLKAPLVTIQGMSSILMDDFTAALGPDGVHLLSRIQANTERLERLISDLLALSRIGREARDAETLEVTDLVQGVLAEYADRIDSRGITVVCGDLGRVSAIRTQMEQVFGNLVGNAIKYMGDQPSPRIEIGALPRGDVVEYSITDNGVGIDPAYHGKVFEIFHRLHEVEADGTGVGLPIVKKIVEAAGGKVWIESARHRGATFRFTWPCGARETAVPAS
jgi:GAF domain-containing protein